MLNELDKLITFIIEKYKEMDFEWKNNSLYIPINMKKTNVKDIYSSNNIFDTICNYRIFVNERNIELLFALKSLSLTCEVNTRVKSQNSIEYKINNYMNNHNFGEGPINKCFNDLYGLRIILSESINYDEINKFIKKKYPTLKCIDSSKKEGYKATHIYFKVDNFSFPWELQVWEKRFEKNNLLSHKEYKQEYTRWEKENKGGVLN